MRRLPVCFTFALLHLSGCISNPHSSDNDVRFIGGSGNSLTEAIVIKGVNDEANGIAAEHLWLRENLPGWVASSQSLITERSKAYDAITVRSAAGKERTIYFDISGFFGKLF